MNPFFHIIHMVRARVLHLYVYPGSSFIFPMNLFSHVIHMVGDFPFIFSAYTYYIIKRDKHGYLTISILLNPIRKF
jgi:ABC-type polysaccharide/polyol phosphate export permease